MMQHEFKTGERNDRRCAAVLGGYFCGSLATDPIHAIATAATDRQPESRETLAGPVLSDDAPGTPMPIITRTPNPIPPLEQTVGRSHRPNTPAEVRTGISDRAAAALDAAHDWARQNLDRSRHAELFTLLRNIEAALKEGAHHG